MPQTRDFPVETALLATDAILADRIGVGTIQLPGSAIGSAGSTTQAFDTLTLFRAALIGGGVNTVSIGGYRNVNDGGAMTLARVNSLRAGTWQSADGAFWLVINNEPNSLMFGAFNDGGSHPIGSADITANPQWIGSYAVGTEWSSVALQELVYTCVAGHSTPGTVSWNVNSGQGNRPMNLLPGGIYLSNQTTLIVAQGFYLHGNQRQGAVLKWTGSPTTPAFYMNAGSFFTIERITVTDTVASNQLVVLDHDGSPAATLTQQGSFRDCQFFGGGPVFTNTLVAINPASGGNGQGDTLLFENCLLIAAAVAGAQLNGQNTLSVIFLGGNFQETLQDGLAMLGSSAFVYGTSFQNSAINFFATAPAFNQIAQGGANFHAYSGAGSTEINVFRDVRSEDIVAFVSVVTNGRVDAVGVAGVGINGWSANSHFPLGYVVGGVTAGTQRHVFMLVDDGGPDWFIGDVSGSTTLAVNLSATWTVNQWVGFVPWERFTNGSASAMGTVTSNTATAATLSPGFALTTAARNIKISGNSGSSPPAWDSAPAGHSTLPVPGTGQGFTTTQGSNVVGIGSGVNPLSVGDYVVIPGAWSLTQGGGGGFSQTSALIGQVTAVTPGVSCTLTRAATIAVTNAAGYWGTGITDGNLTWLDMDFDVLVGSLKTDAFACSFGRARFNGPMDAMNFGRADWWHPTDLSGNVLFFNSRSYATSNEAQPTTVIGAGGINLGTPVNFINKAPLVTITFQASCTVTWPSESIGVQSFEINAKQQAGGSDIVLTMAGAWLGPATIDLGSVINKVTHISAQWDNNLSTWVSRGSSGPF